MWQIVKAAKPLAHLQSELQIVFIQRSETIFTFRKQTCTESPSSLHAVRNTQRHCQIPQCYSHWTLADISLTWSRKEVEPPNPCRPQQASASWFHWKFWYHFEFLLESGTRFFFRSLSFAQSWIVFLSQRIAVSSLWVVLLYEVNIFTFHSWIVSICV